MTNLQGVEGRIRLGSGLASLMNADCRLSQYFSRLTNNIPLHFGT